MSAIPSDGVRVIPLGGVGDIGRNMMLIETEEDLVVIDSGIMFPSEEMFGVDYIIADTTYLLERRDKLRAYLITHGHEDHIGGLPYVLRDAPAPIYAMRLTHGLIEVKLRDAGLKEIEQITIDLATEYGFGSISAEFFPVAHSIPDATGIALRTPAGLIVHTGDFKIDHTPVMSQPTDLPRLASLGEEGVRLLCSDSTYADRAGHTPSELVVGEALEQILLSAPGRVIIATFASQIARLQQIVDGAEVAGRTLFVTGRSMEKNVKMARELGYIKAPEGLIQSISQHEQFADEDVVIVGTGGQGEPMSALSRMSVNDHRDVTIRSGDTVVFSSSPIPGNEAAVNRTVDNLFRLQADVRYVGGGAVNVHVRGHAGQEELKTVLSLVQPQDFMPIHGEYRHLALHTRLARSMGIPEERCHLLLDGAILQLTAETSEVVGEAPASYVYVDGLTVGGVDHTVLRDRRHLARDGVVTVVVPVDHQTGQLAGQIDVIAKGFVWMDESPTLQERVEEQVRQAFDRDDHPVEWHELQNVLRREISGLLYRETRQRPMVLAVAMEV
ncbi:MAG: ribonuclease J [Chloroflexi bacterium]|nr:ribonuclease J [Chloroflexota bacterium]MCZ6708626.1 ribonuclease J [Chloroflexota bacterium]